MAACMQRLQVQVQDTSRSTTVPDFPIAKLMYYFDCICACVELDDSETARRFKDYSNYDRLTSDEKAQLLALCLSLSPDKLIGTIFHPAKECGEFSNAFLELNAVKTDLVVTNSLVVGGQRKNIQKIMLFKEVWMEKYYNEPLRSISRSNRPPPRARGDSFIYFVLLLSSLPIICFIFTCILVHHIANWASCIIIVNWVWLHDCIVRVNISCFVMLACCYDYSL